MKNWSNQFPFETFYKIGNKKCFVRIFLSLHEKVIENVVQKSSDYLYINYEILVSPLFLNIFHSEEEKFNQPNPAV